MNVFFNDGLNLGKLYQEYFYHFEQEILKASKPHECMLDIYNGHYKIINNKNYELVTTVKGPKKYFLIVSLFSREPEY